MNSTATQVAVGEEAPARIRPLKPKVFLLGKVLVQAGHAVNLS